MLLKCAHSAFEMEHNYSMLWLLHPFPLLPHVTLWIIIIHEALSLMWGAWPLIHSIFCKVTLFLLHFIVSFYLLRCVCYCICLHTYAYAHSYKCKVCTYGCGHMYMHMYMEARWHVLVNPKVIYHVWTTILEENEP